MTIWKMESWDEVKIFEEKEYPENNHHYESHIKFDTGKSKKTALVKHF